MRPSFRALRFISALALFVLVLGFVPRATRASESGLTFTDIAAGDGAGIDYRRQKSPSDALFDAIKALPLYTFDELILTPIKSRGAPGVAILDYDGDGDQDLYVTNGPGAANSLYSNQWAETGQVTFIDTSAEAGVAASSQDSTGVCYGDTDNDGDPDLLVLGNLEPNLFFENQGDGTFLDITATSGLGADSLTSASCSLGDVNGDGLLDIVVANSFDMTTQLPIFVEPYVMNQPNQLFLNQGGGSFVDVSASSGILDLDLPAGVPRTSSTISWGIAMVDLDLDGDLDILHADDQAAVPPGELGGIDRGYIQIHENDGSGLFTTTTLARSMDKEGSWMGLSFGDFNRDGRLDFFGSNFGNHPGVTFQGSTDILAVATADSRWFLQNADGTFADTFDGGEHLHTPFGWGTSAADYDNDGDTDLIFHGGLDAGPFVATNPGAILRNDGNGNFSRDAAALAGSTDHTRRTVHGMAVGDLDNNGFVDIVSVSNHDFPAPFPLVPVVPLGGEFDTEAAFLPTFLPVDPANGVFEWSGLVLPDGTLSVELSSADNGHHWIQIETLGTVGLTSRGGVNRDGIGAVVQVLPRRGDPVLIPILGGSSYASQDSLVATAGLGDVWYSTVDVLWPGGVRNRLYDVRQGSRVLFPEIPCSFDDPDLNFGAYRRCVQKALRELVDAEVLTYRQRARFLASALRAFQETSRR